MSDQKAKPITTTDAGIPAQSDEYSLTVGPAGPVLLQDTYLNEKLAHFVRERVPDRVYHVKGGGATKSNVFAWKVHHTQGRVQSKRPR